MTINADNSGSYLLIIHLDEPCILTIGALGEVSFRHGYYVYVGSARRGLRGRVARHLRSEKKLRWHIDYLLRQVHVEHVLVSSKNTELELGQALLASPRFEAVERFGSSDSPLPGHLFYCADAASAGELQNSLPRTVRSVTDEYSFLLA